MGRRHGAAAVALLSLPPPRVCLAEDPQVSFECANPLFRGHWYSPRTDVSHLGRLPIAYDDLVRCRMWNRRLSCCSPSMEVPQQRAFDSRRTELERASDMLRDYMGDLDRIRGSATYRHADAVHQALLDRAMDAFREAIGLAHGCRRVLLQFVAGMICFACDPSWNQYVWRYSDGSVVSVNISEAACIEVDLHCGAYGRAAARVAEQVMESGLAKMPAKPLPDLSMFRNRESICSWLRGVLAMQPLPGHVHAMERMPHSIEELPGRRLTASDAGGHLGGAEETFARGLGAEPAAGSAGDQEAPVAALPEWAIKLLPTTSGAPKGVPFVPVPVPPPYSTSPRLGLNPVALGQQTGFHFEERVKAAYAPGKLFD